MLRNGTKDSYEEEIGSYFENYDRSHTDLDQEVLGRRAQTLGIRGGGV